MARFSIIIPVYNVEKYLDVCVESVLCQSFSDFEVLLIDDGSTDTSGVICDTWAAKDTRIRVIHQENQGLSGARNTGIREASGDYLMFLDSDDWWATPKVLEKIALRINQTDVDVLSLNYVKVWDNGNKMVYFPDELHGRLPERCDLSTLTTNHLWIACAWNKVVHHKLFQQHNLFFIPGIVSEDIDWCVRLALCAEHFSYLGNPVICYRIRTGSLSRTVSCSRIRDLCKNVEECLRLLRLDSSAKSDCLKPYIAYQYATVLYNLAEMSALSQYPDITSTVKSQLYLLAWSNNSKVKLLKTAYHLFGFDGMLFALRLRHRLIRG